MGCFTLDKLKMSCIVCGDTLKEVALDKLNN